VKEGAVAAVAAVPGKGALEGPPLARQRNGVGSRRVP